MNSAIPFSEDFKRILQRTMALVEMSGNSTVHYEHLVLAAITDTHSRISEYLENLGFDIAKSKPLIEKLVQRKVKKIFTLKLTKTKSRKSILHKKQIHYLIIKNLQKFLNEQLQNYQHQITKYSELNKLYLQSWKTKTPI